MSWNKTAISQDRSSKLKENFTKLFKTLHLKILHVYKKNYNIGYQNRSCKT